MSKGNELSDAVKRSLERYFKDMDGEKPTSIYEMVLKNIEAADDRDRTRPRQGQLDPCRGYARHQSRHAAHEDAAASHQG